MIFIFLFIYILSILTFRNHASSEEFNKWAVLIAGSNSYYNYRHQSDVSHSYQLLRTLGGYPSDHIITFMYDDIAYNEANPFPGQLFNEPDGNNVYDGVVIDYKKDDITSHNFLSCLKGQPIDGRPDLPVLDKTNSESHIFIYYSDHGANGLIAMPTGDPLFAVDLIDAFETMKSNEMYNELVFYLEACESGSMFDGLLSEDLSIYAMTAANSIESSYAFYYNETIGTYLADEYSIRWMQDSSKNWDASSDETIFDQYNHVMTAVNLSHVMQYGDFKFVNESIHNFQSKNGNEMALDSCDKNANEYESYDPEWVPNETHMDSRDVKMAYLQYRYLNAEMGSLERIQAKKMVENEFIKQRKVDFMMDDIVEFACSDDADLIDKVKCLDIAITEWECLKSAYFMFEKHCQKFDDYSLKHVKMLSNLCELFPEKHINNIIESVCSS